jgi:site-specific DNA-methyltransferase (cytosine-N4-specific)
LSSVGDTVADIFCGSGTTLLEALQLKRNAVGVDANPLAALISRAKTTPLSVEDFEEIERHKRACQNIASWIEPCTGDLFYHDAPFRSLGWRPDASVCDFWFLSHVVEELAEIRRLIEAMPVGHVRTLCTVCFSAIIVNVSKQDSDTRYVRRNKSVFPGDTIKRYIDQLNFSIARTSELANLIEDRLICDVKCTNILNLPDIGPLDLVVTSPPYPNAYSYHLYHRTRLIWLGYDPEAFKKIEIGSHRKYSAKGRDRATRETFLGELRDIFEWLKPRLKTKGYACFVVGDSTLAGERIDNASLLSDCARDIGFREIVRIGRTISSTRKAFNPVIGKIKTENIVVLQKA